MPRLVDHDRLAIYQAAIDRKFSTAATIFG
jgi:hypothetical protein